MIEVKIIKTIIRPQPRWTWFMSWGEPEALGREREAFLILCESAEVLTLEKLPWAKLGQPKIHYPVLK